VELYNPAAPLDAAGWRLRRTSTSSGASQEITLEATTIAAGGFGLFHLASGALPNDGATLELFDPQGRLHDSITYPALSAAQVYARAHDGADPWTADYPASPGAPNLPAAEPAASSAAISAAPAAAPETGNTLAVAPVDTPPPAAPHAAQASTPTSDALPAAQAIQPPPALSSGSSVGTAYQGGAGRLYSYGVPDAATPTPTPTATPIPTPTPAAAPSPPARASFDIGLFTGILLLMLACCGWLVVRRGSQQERRPE
jgi:hypothetical protein